MVNISNTNLSTNNSNSRMNLWGVGSGMDTQKMIDAQLQMMRLKIDPYYDTKDYYTKEKSIWADFSSKLNEVRSASEKIKNITDLAQKTTYSKEGIVNVTAKGSALGGKYNITVEKLALAHKVMSDQQSDVNNPLGYDGALKIGGKTVNIKSTMSLTDIAKEINKMDTGSEATVVGGHLFVSSKKTGEKGIVNIEAVGGGKQITTTDTSKVAVNVTGDVSGLNNSYSIEVQQLATKHKVESNSVLKPDEAFNYTGDFTINGKTINVVATDKLSDIAKKINDNNAGVKATVENNKLVLESTETGVAKSVTLTDNTTSTKQPEGLFQFIGMTDGTNFKKVTTEAKDAKFTIDGATYTSGTNTSNALAGIELQLKEVTTAPITLNVTKSGVDIAQSLGLLNGAGTIKNEVQKGQNAEYTIEGIKRTSETNTITDAVADMTFELLKESTEKIEVSVKQNDESLVEQMKAFVDTYNKAITFINESSKKEGIFQGENLTKNAKAMLRSVLYEKGTNDMMLFQIGVEGNGVTKDGTIKFDETKFKKALTDNYDGVVTMLSGNDGIGKRMFDKINEYTKASGLIDTKSDSLDRTIKHLDNTIERKEYFFEKQKETLINNMAKFEGMMGMMKKQMEIMNAQLGLDKKKE